MRSSLLAIALVVGGCTPDICARNSDCASGEICTAIGRCAIPADAGGDGPPDGTASTTIADAAIAGPHDAGIDGPTGDAIDFLTEPRSTTPTTEVRDGRR